MTQLSLRSIPNPERTRVRDLVRQHSLATADLGICSGNEAVTDQYRIIRTKITDESSKSCSILITSPSPGDGKSTTAANLAFSLALRKHSSVLLLAGDGIHRPAWDRPGLGLSDILSHKCSFEEALLSVESAPTFSVLTAGTNSEQISDLVALEEWQRFGVSLRDRFQHIVIDSPPFGNTSTYYTLQLLADRIVVVVRPENTSRDALASTLKSVPRQKMCGVVMNASRNWFFWRRNEPYRASAPAVEDKAYLRV